MFNFAQWDDPLSLLSEFAIAVAVLVIVYFVARRADRGSHPAPSAPKMVERVVATAAPGPAADPAPQTKPRVMGRGWVVSTRLRNRVYLVLGFLALIAVTMSVYQVYVILTTASMPAYGSILPTSAGLPPADQQGAFLVLNDKHSAAYPGTLVDLLATTEPGVVDSASGAHLQPNDIKQVLIQSAELGESKDYRVYRIGDSTPVNVTYQKQPDNKILLITLAGAWPPGPYMLDIPSEGMFGGRDYYQFYVDPAR